MTSRMIPQYIEIILKYWIEVIAVSTTEWSETIFLLLACLIVLGLNCAFFDHSKSCIFTSYNKLRKNLFVFNLRLSFLLRWVIQQNPKEY